MLWIRKGFSKKIKSGNRLKKLLIGRKIKNWIKNKGKVKKAKRKMLTVKLKEEKEKMELDKPVEEEKKLRQGKMILIE